ncbi:hypothetical protein B0H13DRAFT_2403744 [Mycena leptocephala]|nr:hypothetical protein B0H13DRAFT_2403744 [Mycena leptocephala]
MRLAPPSRVFPCRPIQSLDAPGPPAPSAPILQNFRPARPTAIPDRVHCCWIPAPRFSAPYRLPTRRIVGRDAFVCARIAINAVVLSPSSHCSAGPPPNSTPSAADASSLSPHSFWRLHIPHPRPASPLHPDLLASLPLKHQKHSSFVLNRSTAPSGSSHHAAPRQRTYLGQTRVDSACAPYGARDRYIQYSVPSTWSGFPKRPRAAEGDHSVPFEASQSFLALRGAWTCHLSPILRRTDSITSLIPSYFYLWSVVRIFPRLLTHDAQTPPCTVVIKKTRAEPPLSLGLRDIHGAATASISSTPSALSSRGEYNYAYDSCTQSGTLPPLELSDEFDLASSSDALAQTLQEDGLVRHLLPQFQEPSKAKMVSKNVGAIIDNKLYLEKRVSSLHVLHDLSYD